MPQRTRLQAGPLSLVFLEGDLRTIKLGDQEVLRRVYVAIRDRNWGTVPPALSNVQVDRTEDSFRISFDVENRAADIDFFWQGRISGDARGRISFGMEGTARSTFLRNRIGFCVLHPIGECAGQPCVVEKVDGTVERGTFPQYIAPHQPFFDIQAICHQVVPDAWAEVRFAGDVFEMEDQRNWTDASFKTYSTPLALPFPIEVKKGTRISQAVTLTVKGEVPEMPTAGRREGLVFSVGQAACGPLPRIGLGVASHGQPLSPRELARLKALNLSHLRVDLRLAEMGSERVLGRATTEAAALGAALEVALHLSDAAAGELALLARVIEKIKPTVCTWLIFHNAERTTAAKWVDLARQFLTGYDPVAKIGAGTDAFFTELNRDRPVVEALDLVSYSLIPQVHAFDNASLVETLETQAETAKSARRFCAGLPLSISPITFKMRFNPGATGPEPEPAPGELPATVDVRQMSLFGAGWTLGSLKYVAESGVYSVTYYETSGWHGVMEREAGAARPEGFHSIPGAVFPLYHVLADVGEFTRGEVIPSKSSDTLRVDGLALRKGDKTRVLLANLGAEPQRVRVGDLSGRVWVRLLDEGNAEDAMRSPEAFRAEKGELVRTAGGVLELELLPYGIARIDGE
jgi:hypothetical protein